MSSVRMYVCLVRGMHVRPFEKCARLRPIGLQDFESWIVKSQLFKKHFPTKNSNLGFFASLLFQ